MKKIFFCVSQLQDFAQFRQKQNEDRHSCKYNKTYTILLEQLLNDTVLKYIQQQFNEKIFTFC